MLTEQEIKTIKDAIESVQRSIYFRTSNESEERESALYALQDLCDSLGTKD